MIWDSLFFLPFLNGLCFAVLLPLLGCFLYLRQEWLAALAYAHVAAAGSLAAMALSLPLTAGGLVGAGGSAALKRMLRNRLTSGTVYALLLMLGWSVSVLLTANLPMAERLGHALFDGQLYFTGVVHFGFSLAGLVLGGWALRRLGRHLLLAHLFPQLAFSRGCGGRHDLAFDLLVAGVLALATSVLGVMAAFAMVFVPAWLAFSLAKNWRSALLISLAFGIFSYLGAFVLALWLDQPFGPMLTGCLVVAACTVIFLGRDCRTSRNMLKV